MKSVVEIGIANSHAVTQTQTHLMIILDILMRHFNHERDWMCCFSLEFHARNDELSIFYKHRYSYSYGSFINKKKPPVSTLVRKKGYYQRMQIETL